MLHGEETARPAGMQSSAPAMPAAGKDAGGMNGSGSTLVPVAREKVWEALLDPEALRAVIPGCKSLEVVGPNEYRIVASVGVGPVRGTFAISAKYSDLQAPESASFAMEASGPLGFSSGGGAIRLDTEGEGTNVHYTYSVRLSGKIATIGGRMLDGAARVLIGAFFDALARQAGGQAQPGWLAQMWRNLQRMGSSDK
jgi:2-furoyl-CoA dehydrogenase large subunit